MSEFVSGSSIRVFLLIENRLLREALVRLFRKRPDLRREGRPGFRGGPLGVAHQRSKGPAEASWQGL